MSVVSGRLAKSMIGPGRYCWVCRLTTVRDYMRPAWIYVRGCYGQTLIFYITNSRSYKRLGIFSPKSLSYKPTIILLNYEYCERTFGKVGDWVGKRLPSLQTYINERLLETGSSLCIECRGPALPTTCFICFFIYVYKASTITRIPVFKAFTIYCHFIEIFLIWLSSKLSRTSQSNITINIFEKFIFISHSHIFSNSLCFFIINITLIGIIKCTCKLLISSPSSSVYYVSNNILEKFKQS